MARKKKRRESYKAYVRRFSDWLRWHFFLGEYSLDVRFETEPDKESPNCAAMITTDDEYLTLVLHVFPIFKEHWDAKHYWTCAKMLTHEFSHPIIHPVWMLCTPTRTSANHDAQWAIYERQVQRLANVVMRNIKKSDWMPK